MIDDVLDVEADTATLGKTAGKDEQHAKPTYVSALGLAPARALARMALRHRVLPRDPLAAEDPDAPLLPALLEAA